MTTVRIPFNRASLAGDEIANLLAAVQAGHISGNGPFTRRAEELLTAGHGGGRSLVVTSCTHALELAASLLRLEPGDEVIVPSFTFVSTAAAFAMHGARPVFVDVRADTLNIDPEAVRVAITPRTKAICAVHYAGVGADPDVLASIAAEHGIALVEDNAHGLFGTWRGQVLGTFGAMSTMSFHETKNITCGEGGALHTTDPSLVDRAEILREKGTDRARFLRGQVDRYTWVDVGSSWVISDLLAGVLVGQLERRAAIQERRARIWTTYRDGLDRWAQHNGVRLPMIPANAEHTSHLFHLRLPDLATRTRFIEHLARRGVMAVFHYQPLHLSPVGQRFGGRPGQHPVTEDAGDTLVRLPLFESLTDDELGHVIESVIAFDV